MNEMVPVIVDKGMEEVPLLNVHEDSDFPIDGRELHKALGIETEYRHWFPRMCEFGFVEGRDFNTVKNDRVQIEGNREVTRTIIDHEMTLSMAKEIAMVQRNEAGRRIRQYLIRVEEDWNKPEKIFARALQMANKLLEQSKKENLYLSEENAVQKQLIAELQPEATYCKIVLRCQDAIPITVIAKDYGWTPNQMNNFLRDKGVQYKRGKHWYLKDKYARKGYTKSETTVYLKDGIEHSNIFMKWTQEGRLFIYNLMAANGVYPLVERDDLKMGDVQTKLFGGNDNG